MRTAVSVVVVLSLIYLSRPVGVNAQSTSGSKGRSPEQVLKDAGLTRYGRCYVLQGEIEASKVVQDFDQHAVRLSADLRREMGVEADLQHDAQKAAMLRERARIDERRNPHRGGSRRRNHGQTNQRRDESRDRRQLGGLQRAASGDQKRMMQDQARYQSLVQSTMRHYAELAARAEIQSALRSLNQGIHPKFALGPVGAYSTRVQHMMVKQLSGKGLRFHHGGVFEPIEEKAFVDRVNLANVRFRELEKSEAPVDDPRRIELAEQVVALHAELDKLNQRANDLAHDPDVQDALEELSFQDSRYHYRVGLGTDAESARHILGRIDDSSGSRSEVP